MILGVKKGVTFEEKTLALKEGDLLFLYTDGITETENPKGDFFGTDRLSELLTSHARLQSPELVKVIVDKLQEFSQKQGFNDDMTIVILKVNEVS